MEVIEQSKEPTLKQADWELDFYSRPIIEVDGKKRWELLITTSASIKEEKPFRWEKICPANEVNSIWLTKALKEAISDAQMQGWDIPIKLRCWRSSMKTMVKRAASEIQLDVISSRRTYSLFEWIEQREREIYPLEKGYMNGPLAPPVSPIINDPIPLPEAVRGDAWNLTSLSLGTLKEAESWPIEFRGLLPINSSKNESIEVPGLRLFSKKRALALAGWLETLEPVKLCIEGSRLVLEAGQEDRWLVTDLDNKTAQITQDSLLNSKKEADGLQFISVQRTPDEELFTGFWMLRDIIN